MSKEIRLGLFIAVALAILSFGIFYIGNKETRFQSTCLIRAQFQNVGGLNNGADVRVGGIRKGTVKNIDLPKRPDGKVTVVMGLESATRDIVKKDSIAADRHFRCDRQDYQFSRQYPDGGPEYWRAADNLASISGKIDNGKGSVGALINDKSVYNQGNKATTDLQENMEALKHNFLVRGFFKKRGYEDDSKLTKNLVSSLPEARPIKTFTYDQKQIFDKPDTAKLKNQKTLDEAGKYLEQTSFGMVVVSASAGTKGDSKKRSSAVPITACRSPRLSDQQFQSR
jgi:phospholipid/cholesterol/gamma-HCH transport system substrate-binding protein